jgi:hypothetical protein
MSYSLVDAVFEINLSRAEKQTLQALCRHASNDGSGSFPSLRTLALETGLTTRGVRDALRSLEDVRHYIVGETSRAGGRAKSVHYRILIPNVEVISAIKLASGVRDTLTNAELISAIQKRYAEVDAPKAEVGAANAEVTSPKAEVTSAESVPNPSGNLSLTHPQAIEAVRAEYLAGQEQALTLNAQQRAALEVVIIGYDEQELRAAVRRSVASGDFDGLKSSKIRAERLTDHLTQWLPKMREEQAERARQVITPEQEAAWVATARAKQCADAIIELEDTRASFAMDGGLLDDEQRQMVLDKLKRLEDIVAQA